MDYAWPGNVRELENVIERMMVTSIDEHIEADCLPEPLKNKHFLPKRNAKLKEAVEYTEAYLLSEAYQEHKSWPVVAAVLGTDRATIYRKAARYGLIKE